MAKPLRHLLALSSLQTRFHLFKKRKLATVNSNLIESEDDPKKRFAQSNKIFFKLQKILSSDSESGFFVCSLQQVPDRPQSRFARKFLPSPEASLKRIKCPCILSSDGKYRINRGIIRSLYFIFILFEGLDQVILHFWQIYSILISCKIQILQSSVELFAIISVSKIRVNLSVIYFMVFLQNNCLQKIEQPSLQNECQKVIKIAKNRSKVYRNLHPFSQCSYLLKEATKDMLEELGPKKQSIFSSLKTRTL